MLPNKRIRDRCFKFMCRDHKVEVEYVRVKEGPALLKCSDCEARACLPACVIAQLPSVSEAEVKSLCLDYSHAESDKILQDRWDDMPEDFPFYLVIKEVWK